MYLRRIAVEGAGIDPGFLELLKQGALRTTASARSRPPTRSSARCCGSTRRAPRSALRSRLIGALLHLLIGLGDRGETLRAPARARRRARRAVAAARHGRAERRRPGRAGALPAVRPAAHAETEPPLAAARRPALHARRAARRRRSSSAVADSVGISVEDARRIELWRLEHFELERLDASGWSGIDAFYGVSRDDNGDERIICFAEVDDLGPGAPHAPDLALFEERFHEAIEAHALDPGRSAIPTTACSGTACTCSCASRSRSPISCSPRRCAGSRPRRVTWVSRRSSCGIASHTSDAPGAVPRMIELLAGNPTGSRIEWSIRDPARSPARARDALRAARRLRARARPDLSVRGRAPVHRAARGGQPRASARRPGRAASRSTTSSTAAPSRVAARAGPEPRRCRVRRDLHAHAQTPRGHAPRADRRRRHARHGRAHRRGVRPHRRRDRSGRARAAAGRVGRRVGGRAHRDGQRHREPRRHRARRAPPGHVHRRGRRGEPDPAGRERRRAELLRRARDHGLALARHPDHAAERVRWCSPAAPRSSSRAASRPRTRSASAATSASWARTARRSTRRATSPTPTRSCSSTTRAATSRRARPRRARFDTSDPARSRHHALALRGRRGLRDASARCSRPRPIPGRKRPFAMRPLMRAVIDDDAGWLERWRDWVGGRDRDRLGRAPRRPARDADRDREPQVPRVGYVPNDGPDAWTAGDAVPAVVEEGRARDQRGERQPPGR